MQAVIAQCNGGPIRHGGITDSALLRQNLAANCVPESVCTMTVDNYGTFLEERRYLMAQKIRDYYHSL
jgi:hypothetical protein